jgi:HSP20 family protein
MAETAPEPKQSETVSKAPTTAVTPFDSLRREIDRLFEDFRGGDWRWPFRASGTDIELPWPKAAPWQLAPAMDLVEKDGGYEITAELPGLAEDNVEVKVAGGVLTIRGEKREEKEERDRQYHLSERRYGAFQRAFRIPPGVDADRIEAAFAKGVLTVTLPKSPDAQRGEKKIAVKPA